MVEGKIVLIFHAVHSFVVWFNTFSLQNRKNSELIFLDWGFGFPMGGLEMQDCSPMEIETRGAWNPLVAKINP